MFFIIIFKKFSGGFDLKLNGIIIIKVIQLITLKGALGIWELNRFLNDPSCSFLNVYGC